MPESDPLKQNLDAEVPRPCTYMKPLLSALSDGQLTGLARWYAKRHTAHCPHCGKAFVSLIVLEARLRAFGLPDTALFLTADRREAVEASWVVIDQRIELG